MRKIVARQHGSAACQPVRVSEDSSTVSLPEIVSREQWLVARKELLAEEKPPSYGGDFNYDFHVTLDESVAPVEYNYRDAQEWAAAGLLELPRELHGTSAFLRDGERVFHTYSTCGRGTEQVGGTHYYLDMTALGRQEDWEEPKGRSTGAPRADQVGAGRT
jgi:predicted dithiol-disulfide oxidoreductase (DUF899 family)